MIEKQLETSIKTVHSDSGGEYKAFARFVNENGISHMFTCPYASAQNGRAERKHKHITEMRLTLLAQAQIPVDYWLETFQITCYLINRLPTPVLSNKSPSKLSLIKKPEFKNLHTFRCTASPCLTPYNQQKLEFHSTKCIFLIYSPLRKGYKCLSPQGRVYISKHVVFYDLEFPYKTLFNSALQHEPIADH